MHAYLKVDAKILVKLLCEALANYGLHRELWEKANELRTLIEMEKGKE